jgi:hypothetical protein
MQITANVIQIPASKAVEQTSHPPFIDSFRGEMMVATLGGVI